jgi:predicted Fe-Mo cluster-binding NifX family protein
MIRVALPIDGGLVSEHFGHAEKFAFFEVDTSSNEITGSSEAAPPPHDEGVIPEWLHREGVSMIITGGLGRKARQLFEEMGIEVVTGAPASDPTEVVRLHFDGTLEAGQNTCGHGPEEGHGGGMHGGHMGH